MTPKIVFLDASTVDYGDIDFSSIKKSGELVLHDLTPPEKVAERIAGAEIAITNKARFTREVIKDAGDLRLIAEAATGYDNIDLQAAGERGIAVANVAGYSTDSVATFTLTFILALATRLVDYDRAARDGRWAASPIFTLGTWPTEELGGKTLGIIGYGSIGSAVGRLAEAFGMRVVAWGREGQDYPAEPPRLDLEQLAAESDFISIHTPLSDRSRGMIDAEFLAHCKKSAYIINMARGPVVDSEALARALADGAIAGAAVDVMEQEPPPADHPLLSAPNIIVTPHIAWAARRSRQRLIDEIGANIAAFIAGERRNRLDPA